MNGISLENHTVESEPLVGHASDGERFVKFKLLDRARGTKAKPPTMLHCTAFGDLAAFRHLHRGDVVEHVEGKLALVQIGEQKSLHLMIRTMTIPGATGARRFETTPREKRR